MGSTSFSRTPSVESRVNTVVGLSGSFFAARRAACCNWRPDLQSDFNTLLNAVRLGMRGVADPEAVGFYRPVEDPSWEYERKVRTVLRGITVLLRSLPLLNPCRYGLFAWQLFSHKLCRWSVPFAMIAAAFSHALLAGRSAFYAATFALHAVFYAVAAVGLGRMGRLRSRLLVVPTYVVLANASILRAWVRYLKGERLMVWRPSAR